MSNLKRVRVDEVDNTVRHPCFGSQADVLVSAASRDHRRIERWCGIYGLIEELRVLLENGGQTDDESTIAAVRTASREALHNVLRVTSTALSFRGGPGDSFEPLAALDGLARRLLTTYGAYRVTEGSVYLTLDRADSGALGKVATLRCAAAQLLARLGISVGLAAHTHHSTVRIGLSGVNGFGWYDGLNTVASVIHAARRCLTEAPAAALLLWDTMLTDSGTPTVAKALGWRYADAHHRYGVGVAALGPVETSSTLSLDGVVALAVLFAPCGPMIVHCHCPSHAPLSAEELRLLQLWLSRCCEAPIPALLIVSGMSNATARIAPPAGFQQCENIERSAFGVGYVWCRGGTASLLQTDELCTDQDSERNPPARSRSPLQDREVVEQFSGVTVFSTWEFHCST